MLTRIKNGIKRSVGRARWERVRMRWWQFQRALAVDHSALRLPWFSRSSSPDLRRLHDLALAVDWQYAPHLEARIGLWMASLAWPVVSSRHILQQFSKNAAVAARSHGVSRTRQLRDLLYFANRHNIPPSSYYWYRMFEPSKARRADAWIHHFEICNLLPALNHDREADRLGDKDRFHDEASRHGLPVAPVIAVFQDGRVLLDGTAVTADELRVPACDLVLKAADLNSGARFERWSYVNQQWTRDGETKTRAELLQHCLRRSEERTHVLQERLFNHPQLAGVAGNGLCTVRMVTYQPASGPAACLMATLRMPTGSAMVDNINAGGLAAPVDLDTGVAGRAYSKDMTAGGHDVHPTSGAPIAGFRLPCWTDVVALSNRAQDAFAWMPFIGWDVVIGPSGPFLLEANPVWSADVLQIPHGRPLGDTQFTPVYLHHWDEANRTP